MKGTFKALYFLGLLVFVAIRIPHQWRRRKIRVEVDRQDGLEYLVMSLTLVAIFFIPVVYASTSWVNGADYRWSSKVKRRAGAVGTAIMAGALWLLWRSHKDLGDNFSPSLQLREGHVLVTMGVYRSIRHPLYAAIWLWAIGQALLLQNRIAGWASLVLFLPLYLLRELRQRTANLARIQPGEKVLDVGCGTGTLAIEVQQRVGATGRVFGVDPGTQQIARARSKAARRNLPIDFRIGVIEHLTFPDQTFDVVLCTLMTHHLPDDLKRQGLSEIARVLKPGGRLVIADFKRKEERQGHAARFHAGGSRVQDLAALVKDAGFSQVETEEMQLPRFSAFPGASFVRAYKS